MRQFAAQSVSLILCSPPYFARERYGEDDNQSWKRYPLYVEWKREFLWRLIEEAYRILRRGGRLLLNVANTESHPIATDASAFARRLFHREEILQLQVGSVPYHRNGQRGGYRFECVFVFRK